MMRNPLLFGGLPETVEVNGREHRVDWGYRAMMLIEMAFYDERYCDEQKVLNALNIFYMHNIPRDRDMAVERMLWFHRCGEEPKKGKAAGGSTKRCYDFEQDAPMIYAAFQACYGITLSKTKNRELHWWEFKAMFEGLDESTKMAKVISYRAADISGMGKEQKRFIKKMQSLYAIKSADAGMDNRAKLAQRNARIQEYVRKRFADAERKD